MESGLRISGLRVSRGGERRDVRQNFHFIAGTRRVAASEGLSSTVFMSVVELEVSML